MQDSARFALALDVLEVSRMQTIDLTVLDTVTGGTNPPPAPGPIKKCLLTAAVAGSIALGTPAGQRHDDPASGPLHGPSSTTTSQCK